MTQRRRNQRRNQQQRRQKQKRQRQQPAAPSAAQTHAQQTTVQQNEQTNVQTNARPPRRVRPPNYPDETMERLYDWLVAHAQDDIAPSLRDMTQAVDRPVSTVRHNLLKLEARGLITRHLRIARSVRVVVRQTDTQPVRQADTQVDRQQGLAYAAYSDKGAQYTRCSH